MLELIRKLINNRSDKPCIVIPGYNNKEQPPKPFACMYQISHISPDVYMFDTEEKLDDGIIRELMALNGEFTFQFDVLAETEEQCRDKMMALIELISYKMRYSDLEPNGIGIVNEEYKMRSLHEQIDTLEWIYRYSIDITFESNITYERMTELANTIEVTANEEKFIINRR